MQTPQVGVDKTHIGQIVDTAGWVRPVWVADEDRARSMQGSQGLFPPGLRFVLKYIDAASRAWLYRMDTGVVAIPAHLVDPWGR